MKKPTQATAFFPTPFARVFQASLVCVVMTLTLRVAQAQTTFTNVWAIPADTYGDLLSSGNNVRGVAINPVTTNVIYATRDGGSNHVSTLAVANGSLLGSGSGDGVTSGTLALIKVRISEDGYIYACNLSGGSGNVFKVYRWASDSDFSTPPLVVYNSTNEFTAPINSFAWRVGDYMDLRGAGANTEIVLTGDGGGGSATNYVLLRATDAAATNFTATTFASPSGTATAGGGVTFEGTANVLYSKAKNATSAFRLTYNTVLQSAAVTAAIDLDTNSVNGLKFYSTEGVDLLASVAFGTSTSATTHRARVYQLTGVSNVVRVLDAPLPAPFFGNGNGIGNVDFANGHVVFGEPNNGISLFRIAGVDPLVVGTPVGGLVVEGTPFTFTAAAVGEEPISYQWYFNQTNPIPNATNSSYAIGSTTVADSGSYNLVAANVAATRTSSVAFLTVLPGGYSSLTGRKWQLAPGARPYLTLNDTQRGLGYDATSNLLVLVSRQTNNIFLLDADTGADAGQLDVSGIFGFGTPPGTFPINLCGVADDGAIYVANLITSPSSDFFCIYRYENADSSSVATLVYQNNPALGRLGDTLTVRGSGLNTELLCAVSTGTNLARFMWDGFQLNLNVLSVTNLPPDAQANGFARLGLAFGAGNTFWAKSAGFNLRQVQFYADGNAAVIGTYTNLTGAEAPLGVDVARNLVPVVAFGQSPQNLSLWDVSGGEPNAILADRELFGSNNVNANGVGAVVVDSAGGRIFALDTNNGLIALYYGAVLGITRQGLGGVVSWDLPGTLQSSANAAGPYSVVVGATSPYTNSSATLRFFRVER
jgi:WD40 repeat protein